MLDTTPHKQHHTRSLTHEKHHPGHPKTHTQHTFLHWPRAAHEPSVLVRVEPVRREMSSTPTLSSFAGAKKTLVPTAAAPEYLKPSVEKAEMSMVEKALVVESSTPTLFS